MRWVLSLEFRVECLGFRLYLGADGVTMRWECNEVGVVCVEFRVECLGFRLYCSCYMSTGSGSDCLIEVGVQ